MPSWNSRGLRGSMLEEALNMTNEQYRKEHLALVQKIPTPITPINIDKEHRPVGRRHDDGHHGGHHHPTDPQGQHRLYQIGHGRRGVLGHSEGIRGESDHAGDDEKRDRKQTAQDGAPGGALGVAADQQPLGIGRGQRLTEHHGEKHGEKPGKGGAVEGVEIFPRQGVQHRLGDRKSTRLNSSHRSQSRMPSSA